LTRPERTDDDKTKMKRKRVSIPRSKLFDEWVTFVADRRHRAAEGLSASKRRVVHDSVFRYAPIPSEDDEREAMRAILSAIDRVRSKEEEIATMPNDKFVRGGRRLLAEYYTSVRDDYLEVRRISAKFVEDRVARHNPRGRVLQIYNLFGYLNQYTWYTSIQFFSPDALRRIHQRSLESEGDFDRDRTDPFVIEARKQNRDERKRKRTIARRVVASYEELKRRIEEREKKKENVEDKDALDLLDPNGPFVDGPMTEEEHEYEAWVIRCLRRAIAIETKILRTRTRIDSLWEEYNRYRAQGPAHTLTGVAIDAKLVFWHCHVRDLYEQFADLKIVTRRVANGGFRLPRDWEPSEMNEMFGLVSPLTEVRYLSPNVIVNIYIREDDLELGWNWWMVSWRNEWSSEVRCPRVFNGHHHYYDLSLYPSDDE